MLRAHLDRIGLVCPTCRAEGRPGEPLFVAHVERADGDDPIEGTLQCPNTACRREHPIIDGIAIALTHIASWAEHQLDGAMRRHDLSAWSESLLGDAAGPTASFHRERHDLSTYAGSHWGDLDVAGAVPDTGTLRQLAATALASLPSPPRGLWVDLGCSLGRGSFELAQAGAELVVGVDLNFSMLRRAEQARRSGRVTWPQRRSGLIFDRREAALGDLPRDRVAFVCADVAALPFGDGRFAGGLSLNVIDCVPSPVGHLVELGRVLAAGAPAVLTTPYDWSASATALEAWIGGHSQRGEIGGESESIMRKVMSPGIEAGLDTGLVIVEERDRIPWRLRLHARSTMEYQVHLLRLARRD